MWMYMTVESAHIFHAYFFHESTCLLSAKSIPQRIFLKSHVKREVAEKSTQKSWAFLAWAINKCNQEPIYPLLWKSNHLILSFMKDMNFCIATHILYLCHNLRVRKIRHQVILWGAFLFTIRMERTYMSCTISCPSRVLVYVMVPVTDGHMIINQTNIYLGIENIHKDK